MDHITTLAVGLMAVVTVLALLGMAAALFGVDSRPCVGDTHTGSQRTATGSDPDQYRGRVSSSASGFPPIESLAFLSDGTVTALVTATGSVEWLCLPRMDGPSVFGAILDRGAGHFRIGPVGGPVATSRRYLPGSLVLETTWVTETGTLVLTDALTVDASGRPESCLVRSVTLHRGQVSGGGRPGDATRLRRTHRRVRWLGGRGPGVGRVQGIRVPVGRGGRPAAI